MMDWTDRHCRYFHRTFSKNILLYTEMVTSPALVQGNATYLLEFDKSEHPLALQLGGSDPAELARAAVMGASFGYDEINLNVGCPSDRVQSGIFGAILMKTPEIVAQCCKEMIDAVDIEVTVKCRIGVDHQDPNKTLPKFLECISKVGVKRVIIHARKALLKKLTPKENLNIPPLKYDFVYKLKDYFKDDEIIINGGVKTTEEIKNHLTKVDGVMIGRAIYHSPYFLADIEKEIFKNENVPTRTEVMENLIPYIQEQTSKGVQLNHIMRHTVGLFHGQNGSKTWKQYLSKNMCIRDADLQKVNHIMDQVRKNNPVSLER